MDIMLQFAAFFTEFALLGEKNLFRIVQLLPEIDESSGTDPFLLRAASSLLKFDLLVQNLHAFRIRSCFTQLRIGLSQLSYV